MNTRKLLPLLLFLLVLPAAAQLMPQDTWRYDGVEMKSPEPDKYLRCVGAGSGGIYIGEGTSSSATATRVLHFNPSGGFVSRFATTFTFILGIACDSAGNVYVLDRGPAKVRVFSPTGEFLRDWGGPGNADGQFSLASVDQYNMIAIDKNDQIYVCDPGNTRVQVFDTNGSFLRKWGAPGPLDGQFASGDPDGIAIHPDGRVFLQCSNSSAYSYIRVFDTQGQFRYSTGVSSVRAMCVTPDGLLAYQNVSSATDTLYVGGSSLITGASNGLAANKSGDIMVALSSAKSVRIYEREYSTVHNSLLPTALPQPVVTNVAQRSGVPVLDIDYKVVDADSPTVSTAALAFLNGNNTLAEVIPMSTFLDGTGANLGANQAANVEKRLSWDMAADWSVDFAQIAVEVLAKDERNPLGIHWITLPAENGQPAVEVSRTPVSDADLLSLWYWFIANKQAGMSFANGQVKGTGGIYGTSLLASGTATTNYGRLFAFEKLGIRSISAAEKTRAMAGNYGFTSVSDNSAVRELTSPKNLLLAWGGTPSDASDLTAIPPNLFRAEITSLAAGYAHNLFVSDSGVLSTMGYNAHGQLGDGTTIDRRTPVQIASGVAQVDASSNHSLFVKTDGTLWAMGYNAYGQLGDGTTTNRRTPVQVASGVAQIAAGYANGHSFFIKTDGTLWAMGYNAHGQLGDGTTIDRRTPVQIASGVAQVDASSNHSLFVKTDGTLWAMGYNAYGQLGDGTTTDRRTPVQVASGVAQVAAGESNGYSFFIKTDGTLWAMGWNGYGNLGDGTTTTRTSPVQVASGVAQVTAGDGHSLFIKTDGTLWAMGYNASGQLGDGTNTQRYSPVQIGSHADWVMIKAQAARTIGVRGGF